MKNGSEIKCVIFNGDEVDYAKYEGKSAIEMYQWIKNRGGIKHYIDSLLYVIEESEVPERLMETLGNACMNLRHLID